jgi:Type ISP C-terminal specificity domain
MATAAIELFYSYAHEDEALRDQLNDHLALLQHQGFIKGWYDRDISAGGLWAEEIDKHLETAQIRGLSIYFGNRSAIEWIIDQYQVTKDQRSGITSNPNRAGDEEYIIKLIKQVITVSVQTVQLTNQLAQAVSAEGWIDKPIEVSESTLR